MSALCFAVALPVLLQPLQQPPPPKFLYTKDNEAAVRDKIVAFPTEYKGVRDGSAACLTALISKSAGIRPRRKPVPQKYPAVPLTYELSACDWVYMELCPKYLSMAYDVSYYGARKAWPLIADLLGWHEVRTAEARQLRAPLRSLGRSGRRYGRHLFIPRPNLDLVLSCLDDEACRAAIKPLVLGGEVAVKLKKLPLPGAERSVSARCPNLTGAHKHSDSSPSLVVWMNDDKVTGGAMCMVCRKPDSSEHLSFRVRFKGDNAILSAPIDATWTIPPNAKSRDGLITVTPGLLSRNRKQSKSKDLQNSEDAEWEGGANPYEGRWDKGLPVGGCVRVDEEGNQQVNAEAKSKPAVAYVGAKLVTRSIKEGTAQSDDSHEEQVSYERTRTFGHILSGSPIDILRRAESLSKGKAATSRALAVSSVTPVDAPNERSPTSEAAKKRPRTGEAVSGGQNPGLLLPVPVFSVSVMQARDFGDVMSGKTGRNVFIPKGWEPVAQEWVLLDLDSFTQLPTNDSDLGILAEKLIRIVRRDGELSGRAAVVQTGPAGLQVWCELREPRETPRKWFREPDTRAWYGNLSHRVLRGARSCGARRGTMDPSACSAGRFGRRPSWRLMDNGTLFRCRLLSHCDTAVPGRMVRSEGTRFRG